MQTTRRYLMVLGLLVGLAGLAFFQYASAQYYTKDDSMSDQGTTNNSMSDQGTTNNSMSDQGTTNNSMSDQGTTNNSMSDNPMTAKDESMPDQNSMKDKSMQTKAKSDQPDPPLVQIAQGIAPDDVQCREGLQLIFKASNDMPACVKPATAMRLVQMGWAKHEMTSEKVPAGYVRTIEVSAIEEDETYKWSGEDGVNPTLIIYANTDNQIQIKNPTDAKHEFVIESEGKEMAASGDISADGSGMVTIKPDTTGTWEYHCEYHPTTMKGTINIVAP